MKGMQLVYVLDVATIDRIIHFLLTVVQFCFSFQNGVIGHFMSMAFEISQKLFLCHLLYPQ